MDTGRIAHAARVGGIGLVLGAIFACTYGVYWVYIHPDRDFWDLPFLSDNNQVSVTSQVVMILVLAPVGAFAASSLPVLLGRTGRSSRLLCGLVVPFLAAVIALLFQTPMLMLLLTPLFAFCVSLVGPDEQPQPFLFHSSAIAVLTFVFLTALEFSGGTKVVASVFILWGLMPALASLPRRVPTLDIREVMSGSIRSFAIAYGVVVLTAFLGAVAINALLDPPRLTLFATTPGAAVSVKGPVQLIDDPDEPKQEGGSRTRNYVITGEGPVIVYYERLRLGSGSSVFGGDDPSDHAVWLVFEPPGTHLAVWAEPGLSVGRVRLQLDYDGDGSTDERRRPDAASRWNGQSGIGPNTRSDTTSCGTGCEYLHLSTDGIETYYMVYPGGFQPKKYRESIQFRHPALVWFWSIDRDGKVGSVGKARMRFSPSDDVHAEIEPDSAPMAFEIANPGQEVKIRTDTEPGQRIALRIQDVQTTQPYEFAATVRYSSKPNVETSLSFPLRSSGEGRSITLTNTEHYYITIVPFRLATGRFTVEIYSLPER